MNSTNLIEDLRLLSPPRQGGWLAIILVVVTVIGLLWILRWRWRRKATPAADFPGPEPWAVALAELESLTPLLTRERSREYGIRSTGTLRCYIEKRYGLRAPTLATEEFLTAAGESMVLPAEHRASLRRFLEWCDLLKFGRYLAAGSELEPLHTAALDFVLATRPVSSKAASTEEVKC